ncbi:unnamed protein product [Meganyctiphanes norvegica]|uniref:Uncharacterized protein n=1 Tax=Meganyctiphanes norvegica TaxID=48144 RepID=A0AAV2RKN5_MEGNR
MGKLPAIHICQILHYKAFGFGHCSLTHSTLYSKGIIRHLTEGTGLITHLDDHKLWIHMFHIVNWASGLNQSSGSNLELPGLAAQLGKLLQLILESSLRVLVDILVLSVFYLIYTVFIFNRDTYGSIYADKNY